MHEEINLSFASSASKKMNLLKLSLLPLNLKYSIQHYQFKTSVKTYINILGELSFIVGKIWNSNLEI